MAWDTVANIITDAAVELGLTTSAISNPYTSTDPNILRLNHLLKGLGQDLLRDFRWSHLSTRHTFSTANGTASYALPTAFGRIIDGTAWNTSDQRPLLGPVGPADWEYLKAVSNTLSVDSVFRIFGDLFYIHPTPTAIETIAYEYVSRYWVDTGGGSTPDAELPTTASDSLFFDRRLLVLGLKLQFRGDKGFEALKADSDFARAYDRAKGGDGAAPVLSLNQRGLSAYRPLGWSNIPDTGYGS